MEADSLRRVLELLRAEPQGSAPDAIAALVREARDEALTEAHDRLRELFVQAILQAVFEGRPIALSEGVPDGRAALTWEETGACEAMLPRSDEPSAPHLEAGPRPDDRQQLLGEMEAIRGQIAANEERLQRAKGSSPAGAALAGEARPDAAEPVADAVDSYAYYVYGLLSDAAARPDDALPSAGIEPAGPVEALLYRGIAAAVSRVPLSDYGEQELAAHLEDLQWIEEKVRRHHEVLGALMRQGAVIPLRFGAIYRDPGRVEEMLAEGYERWMQLLAELQGKQEWGLKLYVSRETLTQQVGEVSSRVQQLKAEIGQQSSGAAYMARKKLNGIVAEEVERLCDECAQDSHDRLARYAVKACTNLLQSREAIGRDEEMLLNGAYLVSEEQWAAFRAEVAALEEQYGPLGLIYTLTGPWPPYSFVRDSEEGDADEPVRP